VLHNAPFEADAGNLVGTQREYSARHLCRLTDTTLQAPVAARQHPAVKTLIVDTFDLSRTAAPLAPPPALAASVEEKMDFLHQQLDSIGPESSILSGLVLLGSSQNQRLQGGAISACIRVEKSTHAT
jgi:hypothetical protein